MRFILGFIAGVASMTFVLLVLTFFRRTIERRVEIIERIVECAGPKPKGFILEPQSEIDEARQAIIEKNSKLGKDTPISELL
jgi:hypothetical protein